MSNKEKRNDMLDATRYAFEPSYPYIDKQVLDRCFRSGQTGTTVKEDQTEENEHAIIRFEKYKAESQKKLIKELEEIRDFIFGAEKFPFESRRFGSFNISHTGNRITFVNDEVATKDNLETVYSKIEEIVTASYNAEVEYTKNGMLQFDKHFIEGLRTESKVLRARVDYLESENFQSRRRDEGYMDKLEELSDGKEFVAKVALALGVCLTISISYILKLLSQG